MRLLVLVPAEDLPRLDCDLPAALVCIFVILPRVCGSGTVPLSSAADDDDSSAVAVGVRGIHESSSSSSMVAVPDSEKSVSNWKLEYNWSTISAKQDRFK